MVYITDVTNGNERWISLRDDEVDPEKTLFRIEVNSGRVERYKLLLGEYETERLEESLATLLYELGLLKD